MSSFNQAVPTLKQMSLVVIAVKISNDPEIKAYDGFPFKMIRFRANGVPESTNDPTSKMWEEIVSKKISCLGLLPNNLESELRSFVHLICLEIDEWQKDHKVCPFPSEVLQRCLRWNPQGKIDRLKSVNTLLNEKGQCQSTCFVLARKYGLYSYSTYIWQKMEKMVEMERVEREIYITSKFISLRDMLRRKV
ncbi:hypothetical protein TNIN_458441 [Trichonephila inaurata madagascariensis]|uniref:Uncharacterized protein n=1 Tax=Trichonephila inaurata madagascariensis TaxID=2747483 RepID=A0A8X6X2F5_9ARAC|nr:hypothetical protein TNIN_458441 [Trichonephila inaurata madagascariensis]